ncbi:MAG: hypothetical protein FJ090_17240 [Deltaproteobacteria bacterium]|nr:hypothetical protein [Deltaproteobacteria bacterium]
MVRAGLDARTDVADAPEPPPGGDGTEFRFALPRETIRPAEDAALADLEEAGFFESQAVPSARPPERAIQPSLPTVRASSRKFVPRAPLPRRSVPTWALAFTGVVLLMVGLAGTWSRIREDVAPPAQPVLALPVAPQPVDPAAAVEPRVTTTPAEAPSRVLVGVLRVVSNAPGEIYVDGKYEVAVEEEVLLELPAGAYDVKLVPQRGLAQTQNVRVDAAEARDVVFQVN